MSAWYKFVCSCECWISAKGIHSSLISWCDRYLKQLKDKIQNSQSRRYGEKSHHIYETYKIQWLYTGVIFMPKHMIYQRLKCTHILSLIVHFHTGNVYCGSVPNVHVSIFLTKKQIISIQKQHPQLGFTFITSLDVVLLMVEFHWKTRTYVTCVNKNLYGINIQKCTP